MPALVPSNGALGAQVTPDREFDEVLRRDFLMFAERFQPLPEPVVNGIARLHARGHSPQEIAVLLRKHEKPVPTTDPNGRWNAVLVRLVLAVAKDEELRPLISSPPA